DGSFPGTDKIDDIGSGSGEGATLNFPLPEGTGDVGMQTVFYQVISPCAQRFKPDIILVSAGYDAHVLDPLAGFQFTTGTYYMLASSIKQLAKDLCGGRCVFFLEGGYNLKSLSKSVVETFRAFIDEPSIAAELDDDLGFLHDEPSTEFNTVVSMLSLFMVQILQPLVQLVSMDSIRTKAPVSYLSPKAYKGSMLIGFSIHRRNSVSDHGLVQWIFCSVSFSKGISSQVILEPPYESRPFRCFELSEKSLGEDIKITDKLESLEKDNNGIKNLDNKNMDVVIVFQEVGKHDFETNKGEVLNLQPPYEESKPKSPNTKPNSSVIGSEVVKVSQVKSDSISTDTMSITEKNELKDNVIAHDVKIEVDLKLAHPSSSQVTIDDGNTKSVVSDAPLKDKVTTKEKHVTVD
nr:histone deacetylase 14 isoform X2 [Tanacetum cinerariifolium]GEZ36121.1 histone deacetylase 14 isoform X2 [Tanacetum cinerariifolium]